MDKPTELILRCKSGGTDAEWTELLESIYPALIATLQPFCGEGGPIDDFAQDALVKIVARAHQYRGTTFREFRAWCVKVAIRIATDHLRKESVKRLKIMTPEQMSKLLEFGTDGHTEPFGAEHDSRVVVEALKRLKPSWRQILTLYYVNELTQRQIGQLLGKSADAVRMQIDRATAKARELFEKEMKYATGTKKD